VQTPRALILTASVFECFAKVNKCYYSHDFRKTLHSNNLFLYHKITGFMFQTMELHKLYMHFNIPVDEPTHCH